MAKLAEIVIPKTDSPGGLELNLHLFVMKMVDDCRSPENQQVFVKGMQALKDNSESQTSEQLLTSITALEGHKEGDEAAFLRYLKIGLFKDI